MSSEIGRPRDPNVDARVVAAACRIVDDEGTSAVSVARVAREAGVSRPAVYRRYADADDLLRAVLFYHLDAIGFAHKGLVLPDAPFIDLLLLVAEPTFRFYAENQERSRALLTAAISAGPQWQARYNGQTEKVMTLAFQCFQRGISRGELPDNADIALCVGSYMSLFMAVLIGGVVGAHGDVEAWSLTLRAMLEQHYEGLRMRAGIAAADV
ncbi:MAG: AcrR family transcriptional regulator [Kiritimatiellia bacterium]|jgi:AcrR family transcriptional regulator